MNKWHINRLMWTRVVYQVSQILKPVCLVMYLKVLIFSRQKKMMLSPLHPGIPVKSHNLPLIKS